MKYLVIVLAILMLGCGTDTEIVEEPTPIEEELTPVKEEPLPVVEEPPPIPEDHGEPIPPQIIESNVFLGNEGVAFDPVPLNQDGIFFDFDKDLNRFEVDLSLNGKSMGWLAHARPPVRGMGFSIKLIPPADGPFLEYDKEYFIKLIAEDKNAEQLAMRIRIQTICKP